MFAPLVLALLLSVMALTEQVQSVDACVQRVRIYLMHPLCAMKSDGILWHPIASRGARIFVLIVVSPHSP